MISLVTRVRLVGDSNNLIEAPSDRLSEEGWGLASASLGTLEGWWTPPPPRAEATDRPQADGAYAPAVLLTSARTVTIVLYHDAPNPTTEVQARAHIAALARGWIRIIVDTADGTRHARAFLSEQAKAEHRSASRSIWTLVLTCPDPRIYDGPGDDGDYTSWAASQGVWSKDSTGGLLFPIFDQTPTDEATTGQNPTAIFTGGATSSLLVDNAGTMETWPLLEVVGPVDWARWTIGAHTVEWSRPVPPGTLLRINTADGTITQGEERISQEGLTQDDFTALPPGHSAVNVIADRPALMRVRWRPAWI